MHSIRFFAGVLPAVAVIACGTETSVSAVSGLTSVVEPRRSIEEVESICIECHGEGLLGGTSDGVTCPSLGVVRYYSSSQFDALLAFGVERSGTPAHPAMQATQGLTRAERAMLYEYLTQRER